MNFNILKLELMKKNLLYMMAASAMMIMLGGCAADVIEVSSVEEESTTSGANTVTFTLSTSSGAVSRATTEYQTEAEKTVSSLLVVIFSDTDEGATNGDTSSGYTDDTFFSCEELTAGTDGSYTFTVSNTSGKGYYQFCLVANADETLTASIKALTTSNTLSDFQNLVVTQDPSTMIMTSESFYGIVTPTAGTTDFGTINLVRLMARIDIINSADGITITSATLKNRAKRALLDNADQATHSSELIVDNESYLEDKTYSGINIATDEGYSSEIYSYEQYETYSSEAYPVLSLTYCATGDEDDSSATTYTHDVEFITTSSGTTTAITLKPNYHYFVNVTLDLDYATLKFTLSAADEWDVADWNEADELTATDVTFNVSNEVITTASSDIAAGDILMSDGTVISADEVASSTADPIGIVYTTDPTRIGEYTKQALGGTATGLALALKNASYGTKSNGYYESMWSVYASSDTYVDVEGIENTTLVKDAYLDYDGYYNSMTVWGLTDYMPTSATDETYEPSDGVYTNYPAFYYAQQYNNTVPVPTASSKIKTTGWYLPTQGEWYDILSNIGQISSKIIDWKSYSNESYKITDSDETGNARVTAAYNINMAMYNIAGTNFDPIYYYTSLDDYKYIDTDKTTTVPGWTPSSGGDNDLRCWFQTSSEVDESVSRIIYFNSYKSSSYALDIDTQEKYKDKEVGYVRCAIAFRILSDE